MSKKTVKRAAQHDTHITAVYTWLLFAPFLTVPGCIFLLFRFWDWDSLGSVSMAVLLPALLHLPLLLPARAIAPNRLFEKRHRQQALLLAAARTASAWYFLALSEGLVFPWLLVNGFLWLWGSLRGRRQVLKGDCWLMRRRGEEAHLPRQESPAPPAHAQPPGATAAQEPLRQPLQPRRTAAQNSGVAALLDTFRHGTTQERKEAVQQLAALGEIEEF